MTDCLGLPAEQYLEAYLQGTLPEGQVREFEEHFADCEVCLAEVEALQAVMLKLGAQPRSARRPLLLWPVPAWVLVPIAAVILLGYLGFRMKHDMPQNAATAGGPAAASQNGAVQLTKPETSRKPAIAELADLTLPIFQESTLRGQSGDAHFIAGLKAYEAKDCTHAKKDLIQVPAQDEDGPTAKLILGICEMHDEDFSSAARTLGAIVDAGDSPQQETAIYYQAQLRLLSNDKDGAERDLRRVVQIRGDYEAQAKTQLSRIGETKGQR